MEHQRRPISTEIVSTEIHFESDGEIPTHINALTRHRRPGLIKPVTRRSQRHNITGDTGTTTSDQPPIRFEGGVGADIANTLGVAQPSGRGGEAEVGIL